MSDAPPVPPDPFQVVKQAYDQAAESWGKAVEQMISTEDFAAAAGRFVDRYADMQETMRRTAEVTVEYLHIPTKEDVARLAQLVINVERKVDDVTDDLYELAQRMARVPFEELSALTERLAAIEARIEALAAAPAVVAAASPAPAEAAPTPAAKRTAGPTTAADKPATPRRRTTRTKKEA